MFIEVHVYTCTYRIDGNFCGNLLRFVAKTAVCGLNVCSSQYMCACGSDMMIIFMQNRKMQEVKLQRFPAIQYVCPQALPPPAHPRYWMTFEPT